MQPFVGQPRQWIELQDPDIIDCDNKRQRLQLFDFSAFKTGADPASNVRGTISVILGSQSHNGFVTVRGMNYTS